MFSQAGKPNRKDHEDHNDGSLMRLAVVLFVFTLCIPAFAQQQFGDIGDLKLVSGEVLRECRVG